MHWLAIETERSAAFGLSWHADTDEIVGDSNQVPPITPTEWALATARMTRFQAQGSQKALGGRIGHTYADLLRHTA